jgi:hypothetical protein
MPAINTRQDKAFPRLDEDDMAQLMPLAVCQSFEPGEKILRFGQADIDLIVIETGSIDILNPMNENKLVVRHGPGEFVGDIDSLTRRPIIIDAVAHGEDGVACLLTEPIASSALEFIMPAPPLKPSCTLNAMSRLWVEATRPGRRSCSSPSASAIARFT